jgi:hypothetical protein
MKNRLMLLMFGFLMSVAASGQVHQIHFQNTPPTLPVVFAGNDTLIKCWTPFDLLGQVTSGTPPYTYLWQPGTLLNDSTVYNPVGSITQTTQFTLTVTDANGCEVSDQIVVDCYVNSIEKAGQAMLKIYPVPARGMVFIEGVPHTEHTIGVTIRTLPGEVVSKHTPAAGNGTLQIPLPPLPAGMYLLEVKTSSGAYMHKIIIQ